MRSSGLGLVVESRRPVVTPRSPPRPCCTLSCIATLTAGSFATPAVRSSEGPTCPRCRSRARWRPDRPCRQHRDREEGASPHALSHGSPHPHLPRGARRRRGQGQGECGRSSHPGRPFLHRQTGIRTASTTCRCEISYPDATHRARAEAMGVSPGGNIMIHGLPNGKGWTGAAFTARWTGPTAASP